MAAYTEMQPSVYMYPLTYNNLTSRRINAAYVPDLFFNDSCKIAVAAANHIDVITLQQMG